MSEREATISVSIADLKQMLESMECDDTLHWCEHCGAWLQDDDPALATADLYTGCWKMATGRKSDEHLCRSHRGAIIHEVKLLPSPSSSEGERN